MIRRTVLSVSCASLCAAIVALSGVSLSKAKDKDKDRKVLFVQRDKVVAFDPGTGLGAQVGTATGAIDGATVVNFKFTITTFPNFTFENRAGITDTDGDQIIFRNVG